MKNKLFSNKKIACRSCKMALSLTGAGMRGGCSDPLCPLKKALFGKFQKKNDVRLKVG